MFFFVNCSNAHLNPTGICCSVLLVSAFRNDLMYKQELQFVSLVCAVGSSVTNLGTRHRNL